MGNSLSNAKASPLITFAIKLYQRFNCLELLICSIYLGYLGIFSVTVLTRNMLFCVALIGMSGFFASIFVKSAKLLNSFSITLLALSIGLLLPNYFPTLSVLCLLFYRLVHLPNSAQKLFGILALLISGVTFLVIKYALPSVVLPINVQIFFNYLSLSLTILFFGYYLLQLHLDLSRSRQEVIQAHARIHTLTEITSKLSRFTPPQIWQPIILFNQPLTVTSQRKKLTILFSDIVGFTELSDHLSPAYLADILSLYFERMTIIANKHEATLDKFIGDGMLCFFGDTAESNDQSNAIKCASMALEMRQAMHELRSQWRLLGFEGLYIRIGINTGECHVGNFGSKERMSYTLIGKAANLAARLESAAQKDQILLSESTFLLIKNAHNCQLLGNFTLKGLSKPIPVWQLLEKS